MPPKQPPLISKAPKVKVLLVKEEMDELEKLLTEKWKIAAAYNHALGALFLLMKD